MNKIGMNRWLKVSGLFFIIFVVYGLLRKYFFPFLNNFIPNNYTDLIQNILIFVIILILNYFFVNFSSRILKDYLISKGGKRDVKLLISVYKYFLWIFVVFITFSILFKQIGSLITSVGLIGFGVTFALQKPILNFVGWLTIVFNQIYKIGDKVTINNISGQVYDVKIMYTALAEINNENDLTGKSVTVPNEFVLTSAVINFSKGSNYVWDVIKIYLTYQSDWKKALKIIEKTIQDYYNKNIKNDIKKEFKDKFQSYDKLSIKLGIYDKGIIIKVRYMVNFDKSSLNKAEISKLLLEKLKVKGIRLGKTESVS